MGLVNREVQIGRLCLILGVGVFPPFHIVGDCLGILILKEVECCPSNCIWFRNLFRQACFYWRLLGPLSRKLLWLFSSNLPGNFALKNAGQVLVNFFWSPFPTKRSTTTPQKLRGNSEQNSGQTPEGEFEKIRGTFVVQLEDQKPTPNPEMPIRHESGTQPKLFRQACSDTLLNVGWTFLGGLSSSDLPETIAKQSARGAWRRLATCHTHTVQRGSDLRGVFSGGGVRSVVT